MAVFVEKKDRAIMITIDRPPLNVLDFALLRELDAGLETLLAELLGKSGAVLRVTLKGLRELSLTGFAEALRRSEEIYLRELLQTDDVEEGVRAFLAKRKPRWAHR